LEGVSNEELRLLLLTLDRKEQSASFISGNSSLQFGSSSSSSRLIELESVVGSRSLQQLGGPCAVAAAEAAAAVVEGTCDASLPTAAFVGMVLLDWGPADW
jgi:hypothetical protein